MLVDGGWWCGTRWPSPNTSPRSFPIGSSWPHDAKARARARSVCAEMHSGFSALRSHCPMNIEASLPQAGALVWRDQPAVRADVQRIVAMWTGLLKEYGPDVVRRIQHRRRLLRAGLHAPEELRAAGARATSPTTSAASARCRASRPGSTEALAEKDFVDFDEPYELRDERRSATAEALGRRDQCAWSRHSTTEGRLDWMPRSAWHAGSRATATTDWWSQPPPAKSRP